MKFIKLEILTDVVKSTEETTNENQSYMNVLQELKINREDEEEVDTSFFKEHYLSAKVLEEEIFHVYARYENNSHSVIEYVDGRSMIVNLTIDKLLNILNDTNNV